MSDNRFKVIYLGTNSPEHACVGEGLAHEYIKKCEKGPSVTARAFLIVPYDAYRGFNSQKNCFGWYSDREGYEFTKE